MTATNHALTGAVIGLVVASPVAVVLALLSHYVLDVIPHYGSAEPESARLKSSLFRNYLFVEAFLCFLIVVSLAVRQPVHWQLAAVCAFAAASPDLLSIKRYLTVRAGKAWKPTGYFRFASGIQWFERPIGAVVEAAWAVFMLVLLAKLI